MAVALAVALLPLPPPSGGDARTRRTPEQRAPHLDRTATHHAKPGRAFGKSAQPRSDRRRLSPLASWPRWRRGSGNDNGGNRRTEVGDRIRSALRRRNYREAARLAATVEPDATAPPTVGARMAVILDREPDHEAPERASEPAPTSALSERSSQ